METSFSYAEIIRAEDMRKDKKAAISDRGHNRKANRKSSLQIRAEEVADFADGLLQHADARQVDDTEVVRLMPVERRRRA